MTTTQDQRLAIAQLNEYRKYVIALAANSLKNDQKIQWALLIISAATTGSVATLLKKNIGETFVWIGLVMSFASTVLNAFQKTAMSYRQVNLESQKLADDAGTFLNKLIIAKEFNLQMFREKAQQLEASLQRIDGAAYAQGKLQSMLDPIPETEIDDWDDRARQILDSIEAPNY
jgi:hypothetical protein